MTTAECYTQSFAAGLEPEPELTVDEWADAHRILTGETAAEPGRYRTDRTPYLREIMRCLSSAHPCQEVVFMKPSQIGGSECGNNWIGYVIDCAPGPMLMVQPTVETAKRYSHQRLTPLFQDTPKLKGRVAELKNRDQNNTTQYKRFRGGVLVITGSNSAAGLKSMPIRYLFMDEIDEYPDDVDGQGDPALVAMKRTTAFANRKIFKASTPSIAGASRIEDAYAQSDQRRYHVPCPHCGARQWLTWGQLHFEPAKLEEVWYTCEAKGCRIDEHQKTWMLDPVHGADWIAEHPERDVPGFHLNALYTAVGLGLSWRQIVAEFLKAKGNPQALKVWTNHVLAETWSVPGEQIDDVPLSQRAEPYGTKVPAEVVILTAGVDVQEDRLEVEAVGWGVGEESWSLAYEIFYGATVEDDVWARLDLWLGRTWSHARDLPLRIATACVDTSYQTSRAYQFVRPRQVRGVYAVKGVGEEGRPLISRPTVQTGGVRLFTIGTNTAKELIYGRLRILEPGPGYCHFPDGYDREYYRQLTAERLIVTKIRGRERRIWAKSRPRNEALDCRIYATAALAILNVDLAALHAELFGEAAQVAEEARPAGGWIRRRPDAEGRKRAWMKR